MCNLSYKFFVCVVLCISLVFGFYRKTEVKNRNRTSRFFIFKKTNRFLMSRKPKNRTEVSKNTECLALVFWHLINFTLGISIYVSKQACLT
jgi:hypothetical protein